MPPYGVILNSAMQLSSVSRVAFKRSMRQDMQHRVCDSMIPGTTGRDHVVESQNGRPQHSRDFQAYGRGGGGGKA
eukprot:CAMPEP_0174303838 /NCGR_PEP_ID=MMETSP0809-20121228/60424_1 /TAXON_ID=73025 ORGANISM="Eutreptiella gymnastica-like, Strain CCMP1594" /NCGR_SAMPLE_ID=MMETSP0809 /ASSEMBLY_ACC=CAM_ASM_000658 /LENGTH=74 /DNA_ID=CAMNT_0015409943 /DNA_START=1193 /DNA_END=1417 /DNA_ORIENTATION=+